MPWWSYIHYFSVVLGLKQAELTICQWYYEDIYFNSLVNVDTDSLSLYQILEEKKQQPSVDIDIYGKKLT